MKLNVPKDKATKILRERLGELTSFNFNPKAWKDRTELDLKEIFPLGSMQWLQVSQINFTTLITSEKHRVLKEGIDTAKQLIESYIDFIEQYANINEQRQIIPEDNIRDKYSNLLNEWNALVPDYQELAKKYELTLSDIDFKDKEIESVKEEMENIKKNTIQFDNITIGKVYRAFMNLPLGQLIAAIAFIVSIIGGSFGLGKLYQENVSTTVQYEIRKDNDRLKDELNVERKRSQDYQNLLKNKEVDTTANKTK